MHMQIDMPIEMPSSARGRATAPDEVLEDELAAATRSMAGQGRRNTPVVVKKIRRFGGFVASVRGGTVSDAGPFGAASRLRVSSRVG